MIIYKTAKWFAILAAILFFCFSTINLIAFALSQNAISVSDNQIFEFISSNYKTLNLTLVSLTLISLIFIYIGFFIYGKNNKQTITKYVSLIIILSTLIWALSQYSIWLNWFDWLNLTQNMGRIIFASTQLIFGISLLIYSQNRQKVLLALAPIYVLQAIFSFSTSYTMVQLADFTIALRIIESVFFSQQNKS